MDFNEKLWIGIGILIFLMLLGYFWALDFWGVRTAVQEGIEGIKEKQKQEEIEINTIECSKEIIPNKLEIYEGEGFSYEERSWIQYRIMDEVWADDTLILGKDETLYSDCRKGNEQDENINYLYCSNLYYNKKTTKISEEGIIGKQEVISYLIKLILKPKEQLVEKPFFEGDNFKRFYRDYEVISATCIKGHNQ